MASYALICALAAGCLASDGTTQPTGTVMGGPVEWDGVSAYAPAGMGLTPWTGQSAYVPAQPPQSPAQQAAALLTQGVTITSTSTPALNGVYSVTADAQANIAEIEDFILADGTFPTGSTMIWLDATGGAHVFPSVAAFKSFATAIAQIVAQVKLYGGGALSSPPAMSATIQ